MAPLLSFLKRCATIFKMAGVMVLVLLLLIPLGLIRSVLHKRLDRRDEAIADITSHWGMPQQIIGPALIVPYRYEVKSWKDQPASDGTIQRAEVVEWSVAKAYFLPFTFAVDGDIEPGTLHRGIYQAVVYRDRLRLAVQFARPDFGSLRIEDKDVLWEDAVVAFAIPDLRGVKESLQLAWGTNSLPLLPGSKLPGFTSGVFARISGLREGNGLTPLRLELALNGSGGVSFAPVEEKNTVKLSSPWPGPSFQGAFLPSGRKVTPEGFMATWKVSYYRRNYAQQWTDLDPAAALNPDSANASLFGVNFLAGIDAYRNVERAIKYGALFLTLVFAAFFLFEILSSIRIHLFQYALVGAAFCLFYLGLLSFSEFMAVGLAYLVSAGITTLLITFYCAKDLHSGRRTAIVTGLLAAIYGFLYIALQLQDYSLLFGTKGLFVVLAVLVYLTRGIDWYARDQASPPGAFPEEERTGRTPHFCSPMTANTGNPASLGSFLRAQPERFREWMLRRQGNLVAFCIVAIVIGAGNYGAVMGCWRDPLQALYTGIKLPPVILLTTLGNGLLNGMLAPLLGLSVTFRQSLAMVLMSFAVTAMVLGALSPLALFIAWNTPPFVAGTTILSPEYALLQLTLAAFVALAGVMGNLRLVPLLREWAGSAAAARNVLLAWLAEISFSAARFAGCCARSSGRRTIRWNTSGKIASRAVFSRQFSGRSAD